MLNPKDKKRANQSASAENKINGQTLNMPYKMLMGMRKKTLETSEKKAAQDK